MSKRLSVKKIVQVYLEEYGYDGLFSDAGGDGCGCKAEYLMPCDSACDDCMPGYLGPGLEGEGDFGIYAERQGEAPDAGWRGGRRGDDCCSQAAG